MPALMRWAPRETLLEVFAELYDDKPPLVAIPGGFDNA